jgi:hypothetical protein
LAGLRRAGPGRKLPLAVDCRSAASAVWRNRQDTASIPGIHPEKFRILRSD